MTFRISFR